MRPSEALAKHRDEVLAIIARHAVSNPRVFGSVARGEDEEGSDLDMLVHPEGPGRLLRIGKPGYRVGAHPWMQGRSR